MWKLAEDVLQAGAPWYCEGPVSRAMSFWPHNGPGVDSASVREMSLKGKAIPLQTWTGPEGSRRLRVPDFKTVGT